jgi:hypothetical protein
LVWPTRALPPRDAVGSFASGDLELPRDVTGVQMSIDAMDTLGAALRLQPETRRVVVVGGPSALDKRWVAATRAALADAPAHLGVTYVTELPLEAVASQLAALPDRTIVLLVVFLRESTGRNLAEREQARGRHPEGEKGQPVDDRVLQDEARRDCQRGGIAQTLDPRSGATSGVRTSRSHDAHGVREETIMGRHGILHEGILVGLAGAAAVAIWFFLYDLALATPFRTPALLGAVLFDQRGGSDRNSSSEPITSRPSL